MQTTRFCLDRHWRFTCTPQSVLPRMLNHETTYAFSKGNGAQGPATLNFDDGAWEEVVLPHDWQHATPFDLTGISSHGYHPAGVCWYRRTFLLEPGDAEREIQLVFDGVSGVSDIYFNGAKLLHNESCYNGFSLSLTDFANFGATPNVVAVRVDKTVWEGWWYEGCGINRHVWLIKRPRLHTVKDGLWIKPWMNGDGAWRADCEITLHNASTQEARGLLRATVLDADGECCASAELPVSLSAYGEEAYHLRFAFAQPNLWDLDSPYLYTLRVGLEGPQGTDISETRFGLRTIRVDADTGFYLNGRPVKLLGTCNHQDHAGVGAAIPRDLWRYRLGLLKEMGSNAYRCSHNPPPPELLDLCDEMGILVMDENRCYSTAEDPLRLLRSMVRRDRNHPSVVMYSLFNEEPMQGTPKGKRLALHQLAELQKLDDTRPVLGAFNGGFFEESGAGCCLDVTGINYFLDSFDAFHQRFPHQPIVSSETASAFATRGQYETNPEAQLFGNFDEDCAPWGETAREANLAVLSRPYVMGLFVWTGLDYRGEPTPYEWPSVSSHFGIMDTCGFPKDVYYLYQAFWRDDPRLHLLPHWNHTAGKRVRVMAYTNCDEVELFLNGRTLGRQLNDLAHPPEWEVAFEPGTLSATGYRGGACVAADERRTTGAPDRFALSSPMPCLYPDTDSVAAVTVMAEDAEGRECPTARNRAAIAVVGGVLLGVGNGDPNCHDPDIASACRLFGGRCQLIIAASPGAEWVTVSVSGRGMRCASLTLPVCPRPFPASLPATGMRLIEGWRMSHAASSARPDPAYSLSANDMNSMEPISFTGVPQPAFDGCGDAYCLYHVKADLGPSGVDRHLIMNRVRGMVELFLDGTPLYQRHCFTDERLEVPVPTEAHGFHRLSAIIRNSSVDKRAGILDPVILIISSQGGPS